MSTTLRGYRFHTNAQWDLCLSAQVERVAVEGQIRLGPLAPYAHEAAGHLASNGGHAPTPTRSGETLWRDDDGQLHRLESAPTIEECLPARSAPGAIARARRLVAATQGIWALGDPPHSLQCFEEDTLTRRFTLEIPEARVVDIAGDGHDGVYALVEDQGGWRIVHHGCTGALLEAVSLAGIRQADAMVFLSDTRRFVLLANAGSRLVGYSPDGGDARFTVMLASLRPCFTGRVLGSDSRDRVLVGGADGTDFGDVPSLVALDGDGVVLSIQRLAQPATGLAASADALFVTDVRGLDRYPVARAIPDDVGQVQATLLTPALQAPDTMDGRRWLRIEAVADLPPGTTLTLSCAGTSDVKLRDRAAAIANNASLPASRRMLMLRDLVGPWRNPASFNGHEADAASPQAPFSAPLFDVREQYLWVSATLTAAPGARLPSLSALAVLYPGPTLMDHLPAIYRQAESNDGDFLRSLVGILEATTQSLDSNIAQLGSRIDPSTAPREWLDFVARWLGLPWDDALELAQKQRIAIHAADIARGRGTRAGLEMLLDTLMPQRPRRFRVIDVTADHGIAIVGGGKCRGSTLPVVLGGLPMTGAELGAKAVLGRMRLPCEASEDDGLSRIVGKIRIDVAATARERKAWASWLSALVMQMVPVACRVEVRWLGVDELRPTHLGDAWVLGSPSAPHLGTDSITGLARLPQRGTTLSHSGAESGSRLH
jgi:phage tail-like protein